MVLDCCGEHSDYGLLTLVNQAPHVSALQVSCCHSHIQHLRVYMLTVPRLRCLLQLQCLWPHQSLLQ